MHAFLLACDEREYAPIKLTLAQVRSRVCALARAYAKSRRENFSCLCTLAHSRREIYAQQFKLVPASWRISKDWIEMDDKTDPTNDGVFLTIQDRLSPCLRPVPRPRSGGMESRRTA